MTRTRPRHMIRLASSLALLALALAPDAHADSVAQVQTAKRIARSTVELIDPESGTSSGGSTTDVKYAVGDILTFTFQFTPVPNGAVRGLGGYITEYVPANTQVVGARIIDRDGNTVVPHRGGMGPDGWGTRGSRDYDTSNEAFKWTPQSHLNGSLSQLYADTGIFFSTDARTTRAPADALITVFNGIEMVPDPTGAGQLDERLGIPNGGPFFAHNTWDWIQAMAFGTAGSHGTPFSGDINTAGTGNTPYLYGSAIAGPQTYYPYEATQTSATVIQPNNTIGPWQRIAYPGSETGVGIAATAYGTLKRVGVPTTAGWNLSVDNPLPIGTNAVRYAVGELVAADEYFAEISLRVLGSPLDPVLDKDANCAEVFGGDASAFNTGAGGKDNTWRYFVPSPACVLLNLLFELDVDTILAAVGETLTYTITAKNLSTLPQSNVVITQDIGENLDLGTAVISDGGVLAGSLITWPTIANWPPGAEVGYTGSAQIVGTALGSTLSRATYTSTQLPAPGFSAVALTNVGNRALIRLSAVPAPTTATAGSTFHYTVTIENEGNGAANPVSASPYGYKVQLPVGFTIVPGTSEMNGGAIANPTGGPPTYSYNSGLVNLAAGASSTLEFDVAVAGGTADGLYSICIDTWHHDGGFNKDMNDAVCGAGVVAVGAVRSDTPIVHGPLGAGASCVSGTTSESDGATVEVFVNGILRGTTTATGGTFSVCGIPALFGGQHVTAQVTAAGELPSLPSDPQVVVSLPECSDGLDNDGDMLIDFPEDSGCDDLQDGEADTVTECNDGLDNDGMNGTDYPADPSCESAADDSEDGITACADGVDNDHDGLVDALDPGCVDADDPSEVDLAVCENGEDDEMVPDGFVDFPTDLGCHAAIDDDESSQPYAMNDGSPRLLLLFDTSGSMNWHTCANTFTGGDGSAACPGNDVTCLACPGSDTCDNLSADDSRLDKVKRGITDVIGAFGEVDYALMRFKQQPVPFACPTSNASLASGGWQGAGAQPCGALNAGELLVGFAPENVPALLEYMDGSTNYPGPNPPAGKDVELRGSGTTPIAGSLVTAHAYLDTVQAADVPFGGCRPYRVILVTDGAETCGGDPVLQAGVLAADGFDVHVIGFATPEQQIIDDLNAIALAGGTDEAVFVDDETTLSLAIADIVSETIRTELCNGVDDDCDLLIDEGFGIGDSCNNGKLGTCYAEGTIECLDLNSTHCDVTDGPSGPEVCDALDNDCNGLIDDGIVCAPCVPSTEICNGVDDDCDVAIDEDTMANPLPGVDDTCGIMVGACTTGTLQCVAGTLECSGQGPAGETCNNVDDDCDGFVDGFHEACYTFPSGCTLGVGCFGRCRTGLVTCTAGVESACVDEVGPEAMESCNGIDDDCNGATDEDWPTLGDACDNGLGGGCKTTGVIACTADETGVVCTAPAVTPGPEVCNGKDEDCDGEIDEGILPAPVGNDCGGGAGCTGGKLACVAGEVVCTGATGTAETCDNADNDCDGFVDEEVSDGAGEDCTDPDFEKVGARGECAFGKTTCVEGEFVCQGYRGPEPEVCNGLDDDCDGTTDQPAECPNQDGICRGGECLEPCATTEFPCGFGFYCDALDEGDYCVPDPCVGEQCSVDEACERESGGCVEACEKVNCVDGEVCLHGLCTNCFQVPCAKDEICIANEAGIGVCEPDRCRAKRCDDGEACVDGECIAVVCEPGCGAGERCVAGACERDACAEVRCAEGDLCDPASGDCGADLCAGKTCARGRVCVHTTGACAADPCRTAACPKDLHCVAGFDGTAECIGASGNEAAAPTQAPEGRKVLATGGGGFKCATGTVAHRDEAGSAQAGWLLAVLALAWCRRRSRSAPGQ